MWREIFDAPVNQEGVLFGKWFVDDSAGYFGESRWLWFASGSFEEGDVWLDREDDFVMISQGFDSPTHWMPMPEWGQP